MRLVSTREAIVINIGRHIVQFALLDHSLFLFLFGKLDDAMSYFVFRFRLRRKTKTVSQLYS